VASYADVVQSVDREALADALDDGAQRADRRVDVLLQVALSDEPGRGGALPGDLPALADRVAVTTGLRLRGLMAVAPQGQDAAAAFDRLAALLDALQGDHPGAVELSAGMSGDLEQAVAAGATIVRVGTALLGPRPPVLR
jgi:uncharacterized pyridoxal phosphate-containing UPF0001 family protein